MTSALTQKINTYVAILIIAITGVIASLIIIKVAYNEVPFTVVAGVGAVQF